MSELFLELTEDQFDDRFPLRPNHLDTHDGWTFGDGPGCLFAPHGDEAPAFFNNCGCQTETGFDPMQTYQEFEP